MTESIIKKLIEMIEPKINEWLQRAFDVGYKIGEEDASRRMYDLYLRGYASGAVDAYDKLGAIQGIEEISAEEFEKIMTGDVS
jgi:hypothetical protein